MKTIVEKNRMIAEFMGIEHTLNDSKTKRPFSVNFLYHSSWDAIMPVVDKIYSTGLDEHDINEIGDITHALLDVNISAVHEAVVKFIEMYRNMLDIEDEIASDMDRD